MVLKNKPRAKELLEKKEEKKASSFAGGFHQPAKKEEKKPEPKVDEKPKEEVKPAPAPKVEPIVAPKKEVVAENVKIEEAVKGTGKFCRHCHTEMILVKDAANEKEYHCQKCKANLAEEVPGYYNGQLLS